MCGTTARLHEPRRARPRALEAAARGAAADPAQSLAIEAGRERGASVGVLRAIDAVAKQAEHARCGTVQNGSDARAREHTAYMSETLAVFQPARFWLKADAEENICAQHRRHGAKACRPSARRRN